MLQHLIIVDFFSFLFFCARSIDMFPKNIAFYGSLGPIPWVRCATSDVFLELLLHFALFVCLLHLLRILLELDCVDHWWPMESTRALDIGNKKWWYFLACVKIFVNVNCCQSCKMSRIWRIYPCKNISRLG